MSYTEQNQVNPVEQRICPVALSLDIKAVNNEVGRAVKESRDAGGVTLAEAIAFHTSSRMQQLADAVILKQQLIDPRLIDQFRDDTGALHITSFSPNLLHPDPDEVLFTYTTDEMIDRLDMQSDYVLIQNILATFSKAFQYRLSPELVRELCPYVPNEICSVIAGLDWEKLVGEYIVPLFPPSTERIDKLVDTDTLTLEAYDAITPDPEQIAKDLGIGVSIFTIALQVFMAFFHAEADDIEVYTAPHYGDLPTNIVRNRIPNRMLLISMNLQQLEA